MIEDFILPSRAKVLFSIFFLCTELSETLKEVQFHNLELLFIMAVE